MAVPQQRQVAGRLRPKQTHALDCALLVGLCLLFFWRDLTPNPADRRGFAAGDFFDQFYAFAHYQALRLRAGQLPLWNPYTFSGHPFLADIQSAVFYPLRLVTMLLTAGGGFSAAALQIEALAHYPIAAIGTYLLARRWTGSRVGGLIAAITFAFSGYLTSYPPLQLAVLEVQAWLPWLLLLLDVAGERLERAQVRRAARWVVAAGLVLGVSFLAGHPQSSLLVTYGCLAFGAFRFWPQESRNRWASWARPAGLLALFVLAGCGLAAIQLLPSWQYMALSTRASIGYDQAGGGFTPYDLIQIVLPAVGVPVPALYVGILPLGLAALALTRRDKKIGACRTAHGHREQGADPIPYSLLPIPSGQTPVTGRSPVAFLGWGALVSLLLSLGKFGALYQLFYLIVPGWSLFRDQERTIVWAVLGVALLAGFGGAWLARAWSRATEGRAAHGRRPLLRRSGGARNVAADGGHGALAGSQPHPVKAAGATTHKAAGRAVAYRQPTARAPAPFRHLWAPGEHRGVAYALRMRRCPRPGRQERPAAAAGRDLARWYLAGAAAAAALALAFFVGYQAGSQPLWGFTAGCLFLALLAALAALALYSRQPALLVVALAFDLFTLTASNHAGPATADPFPPQPLLSVPLVDKSTFRVANENRLPLNYGDVYGLEDISGASPLRLAAYQELLDRVPAARAWQLLNVKYVLTARQSLEVPAERIAQATGQDGRPTFLYRISQPAPRAWLAGEVITLPDGDALWQRLAAADFDPARQVILPALPAGFNEGQSQAPGHTSSSSATGCTGTPSWLTREPEYMALSVASPGRCVLVLSEVYFPGWQAEIDGRPAELLRADGTLRALSLPVGSHSITLRLRPAILEVGAAVSAASLLLAVAWLFWSSRYRRGS